MRAKKNKKEKLNKILIKLLPFVFLIVVVIWCFALLRQGNLLSDIRAEREKEISKQLIDLTTPTITLIPTPTLIKITYAPPPTLDPDPPVHCNISANCGGGTTPLKQSDCNNSTCCQIGNKWIFYKDKNKCIQDQGGQVGSANPTPQTQKTQGNNFYCWNNAYGYSYYTSSGDQCNLDNLKSSTNKICLNTQKMKVDSCDSACNTQLEQDKAACAYAYTGPNASIEQNSDKYGECLNGTDSASSNFSTCLAKCSDQYSQDLKQCN